MEPVTLFTERLELRGIDPGMYHFVLSTYDEAAIMKFFGHKTSEELNKEKLRFKEGATMYGKSFHYFLLIDKGTQNVMGWCGYHTWYIQHRRAEIGYGMNDDIYKGKGYMKEALSPVIKFGFDSMNLHRIEALVSPGNVPSLQLVKKYGFTEEGTLREHYIKDGDPEDSVMFSLLKKEFK